MKFPRYALILLLIVLLGLFLRIYNLGSESIWLDEGISLRLAQNRPAVITIERALNNHPPLYFVTLHYWIRYFGNSPFSVRLLSLLFGFLSIFIIYKIGSLILNKETGILTALLLALSIFQIYYSQEIRMYSLTVFLTLLSMYFFIRLFMQKKVTGYILASTALLYTHFSGLLIIFAQNIYFITTYLFKKKEHDLGLKKWVKCQFILFILYIPWIWIGVLRFKSIQDTHFPLARPSIQSMINSLLDYSGSFLHLFIFIILVLLIFLPLKKYKKNTRISGGNKVYLLLLWLFTPIVTLFAISRISNPIYVTKYTMVASPAFYLLVALGIENIRPRNLKAFTIGIIVFLSLSNFWRYSIDTNKIPWEDAANYIELNAKPGDLLIFNDALCSKHAFEYYFKRTDVDKKLFPMKWQGAPFTVINDKSIKELEQASRGYPRIWIILSHTIDTKMLINSQFIGPYRLLYHKIYPARSCITHKVNNYIEVFLFEKR